MRLFHRTLTGRPSAPGASLSTTSRRPFERALAPHDPHNTTCPAGVCTPTPTSPRTSSTPVTSKPAAPNHAAVLTSTTRGLPSLGLCDSHKNRAGPHPQWWTLKSPQSQLQREDPVTALAETLFEQGSLTAATMALPTGPPAAFILLSLCLFFSSPPT